MVVVMLALVAGACTRVDPGYVGIKVNMSGSQRGVEDFPAQTGWVFYTPGQAQVFQYPTFVQNAVYTAKLGEGNPVNEEITFSNADQMQIAVDVGIGYQLDPAKVPAFYVKFRNDDLKGFSNGFLHTLVRGSFDDIGGHYHIEKIMGDNAEFLHEVQAEIEARLQPLGVNLVQFSLLGIPRPPQAVIDAINAKVHATQLATQKQNELVQVDADMAKEKSKAEQYSANTLLYAQRQAESNRILAASITPTLVEYMKAQAQMKWDGKLPQVTSGATPIIDLRDKQ